MSDCNVGARIQGGHQEQSDQTLREVYERIIAGDCEPSELFLAAQHLIPPVVEKRLKLLPGYEYLRDDLLSQGNIGIGEAIKYLRPGILNIAAHVSTCIYNALDEVLLGESDQTSRSLRQKKRLRAQALSAGEQPVTFQPGELTEVMSDSLPGPDESSALELLDELVNGCCADPTDQTIVTLRRDGYTDAEIGQRLTLDASTIRKRRRRIEARFVERNPEYALGA